MRKLLEILRMRFGSQLSFRQISRSVRVSVGTVSNYVKAFQESELSWPLAEDISEPELIQALFPDASIANRKGLIDPDWAEVHQELKRKEVTKQRLWEEYCQAHPLNAYSYAQYCHRYNQWRGCQKRSMRQPPCVSIVVASPEIRNLNRGRSMSNQWPAIQKSSKSPSFRR
ncbi:hypothetical protein [Endozoicomonas sp. SCSIO W0465]|uniref:hypothetical protein n=1 Tax=Endozoicomonas sp. SCSIO W0465 TaxID=2918516 RepID=UPI00207518EB|nr:hypothetical protein [Endozoicomonas sp. SCSIO W0465]USE37750.1 hypothetical protein MJO57_06020 [Endozoicomonas sp. SCSIO W0465]